MFGMVEAEFNMEIDKIDMANRSEAIHLNTDIEVENKGRLKRRRYRKRIAGKSRSQILWREVAKQIDSVIS